MQLEVKIWLAGPHRAGVMGAGRADLLREIRRCRSLRLAAQTLHISYRKAWGDLRAMEQHFRASLVHRQRGGRHGGSSELTPLGEKLLRAFDRVQRNLQNKAAQQFDRHLKPILLDDSIPSK